MLILSDYFAGSESRNKSFNCKLVIRTSYKSPASEQNSNRKPHLWARKAKSGVPKKGGGGGLPASVIPAPVYILNLIILIIC